MEVKSVLFKQFADSNVLDIEPDGTDTDPPVAVTGSGQARAPGP